jgi:N-acetylneuraminate lyase
LTGLVAATFTPMRPDGSMSLDAIPALAGRLIAHRVTGAFIGGTTGESHSLTLGERLELIGPWAEAVSGTALKLIVHVGANCLQDAQALAAAAAAQGAHAIAALAPGYFKPATLEALVDFCAAIAGRAPALPFYFYDIPAMTGVSFPMVEFLEAAGKRIPNLAGIKYTNPDLVTLQQCLRFGDGSYDILFGNDETLLSGLALGVRGAIGSTYNFAAPLYHRILDAFARGDFEAARAEQARSVALVRLCQAYGFLPASKSIMQMVGIDCGPVRAPLTPLTPEQVRSLRLELDRAGFFDWIRP